MAIQGACPSCGHEYSLADRLEGKKVACQECGEDFVVKPGGAKDKPEAKEEGVRATPPPLSPKDKGRSQRRRDDDEDDEPRRSRRPQPSSNNAGLYLILGGGGLGVLLILILCVGAPLIFILRQGEAAPVQAVVVADPVQVPKNPPVQQPIDQPPLDPIKKDPPKKNPPKKNPPPFEFPKDPPPPPLELPKDPPPPFKWAVQPDPGPDMTLAPENVKGFALLPPNPHVMLPSTPSPFLAVRQGFGAQTGYQVFDLRKFSQVAAVNGKLDLNDDASLSPDGKFLAGKGKSTLESTSINVLSFAENKFIQTIQLETKASSLRMVDFAEDGHLVTYKTHGLTGYYEIYNIATGREVKRFTVEGLLDRKNNLALSPGRKYLAVAHKNQIDIFHLVSGTRVGEIRLPPGDANFKALAFSPDGTELACLTHNSGSSSQILTWKMTTGESAIVHKFAKDVQTLVKSPYGYQGAIMEWVPDNSGWLLYGQLLVDYQSGAPVYSAAFGPKEFRFYPRRMIGKDHFVQVSSDAKPLINFVKLPSVQIAAAVKTARAGAGQPVAGLPEAKPADLAAAKKIPAPNGNVAWAVELDPAPAIKAKLAAQPIQLRNNLPEIVQILFSAGNVGQAVVVSGQVPNPLSPRIQYRADRFDLANGKFLGTCELFATEKPEPQFLNQGKSPLHAEVSPDGTRLIVRKSDDRNRLDVWNLADGKHLVGWQPGGSVDSFAMLDADRVLTSADGKLILWKIPECQAIYVAEGYRGPMQFSPGRKYVAIATGVTLNLVEAATGECKGQLDQPGDPAGTFLAAAFSRDGKEFAASLVGSKLAHWSLAKGNFLDACKGGLGDQPLAFMGKHVLQRTTLFDWKLKGALWSYQRQAVHAANTPDGRHWFATNFQNATVLTAQTLPDAPASAFAAMIAAGNAQPVATPGMAMQIQINAGPDKFRTQVQNSLKNNIESQGFKMGPGGLTISVSAQEGVTGRVIDFEITQIGGGFKRERIKITEKKITCQYTITDPQGVVISKNESVFTTPGNLNLKDGNDYDRQLTEAMWRNAESFGGSVPLPTSIYRIQGQLHTLPKLGPLNGGG